MSRTATRGAATSILITLVATGVQARPPLRPLTQFDSHLEFNTGALDAIAVDASGRLALGDTRGLRIGAVDRPHASLQRVSVRGGVQDIAWLGTQSGTPVLLVATDRQLYRVERDSAESVSAGRARDVARITTAAGVAAIATSDGVLFSRDGRDWRPLAEPALNGPASAIALRALKAQRVEWWAIVRGQLWRGEWSASDAPASRPQKFALPLQSEDAVEIAFATDASEIAIVYPDALVVGRRAHPQGWQVVRPPRSPGSSLLRLCAADGRYWLASDRGLLHARSLRGPWTRAAVLGAEAARDLATANGVLYVATDRGLGFVNTAQARPASDTGEVAADAAPRIDRVHRAALMYLGLHPSRIQEIHDALEWRGFWPKLAIAFSRDTGTHHGSDYDEAFITGGLRRLRDRDRDRFSALEFQVNLSWNLGDIAYHPEQIDVSRERREVIELRDEVLDEITQLYFERRRIMSQVAALSLPDGEVKILRSRAQQLAAGIDAWTGGWFSRQIDPSEQPRSPESTERDSQ